MTATNPGVDSAEPSHKRRARRRPILVKRPGAQAAQRALYVSPISTRRGATPLEDTAFKHLVAATVARLLCIRSSRRHGRSKSRPTEHKSDGGINANCDTIVESTVLQGHGSRAGGHPFVSHRHERSPLPLRTARNEARLKVTGGRVTTRTTTCQCSVGERDRSLQPSPSSPSSTSERRVARTYRGLLTILESTAISLTHLCSSRAPPTVARYTRKDTTQPPLGYHLSLWQSSSISYVNVPFKLLIVLAQSLPHAPSRHTRPPWPRDTHCRGPFARKWLKQSPRRFDGFFNACPS